MGSNLAQFDTDEIRKALSSKGFVAEQAPHHEMWYFHHNGNKTSIRTRISRGTGYKTYGDQLLSQMKRQLQFENRKQFDNFIKCPLDMNGYIEILKIQNILKV